MIPVIIHSKYNSIEEFIEEVLISFSKFAKKDKFIFIKHHPVDREEKIITKPLVLFLEN